SFRMNVKIPESTPYSSPYWLRSQGTEGMYKVDDPSLIGLPETPRTLKVIFNYKIDGQPVSITKDLVNKYNSPERGEVYRPLEVVPAFSVRFLDKVYVFADESGKEVH